MRNAQHLEVVRFNRLLSIQTKRSNIRLCEDAATGELIINVEQTPVLTREDVFRELKRGTLMRSTASTKMNATSSRSHAVFTINISVTVPVLDEANGSVIDQEMKCGKFHFVDLAGSERLGRTGATGSRFVRPRAQWSSAARASRLEESRYVGN